MRYEIKIPLTENNLSIYNDWLLSIKNINLSYKERRVSSIYFDDVNLNFASDNLSGISERLKLRLRWYDNSQKFNYEIKIKKNKLGKKIIIPSNKNINDINLKNLYNYNNQELINQTYSDEIRNIIDRMELLPIIKVSYTRIYFTYLNSVRLTFDKPSTYFNYMDHNNKNYFNDYMYVLEIKFDPNDYILAQDLLKNSPFVPKRFSKYLRGLSFSKMASYI